MMVRFVVDMPKVDVAHGSVQALAYSKLDYHPDWEQNY